MDFKDKVFCSVFVVDGQIKCEVYFLGTTADEFIKKDGMSICHPLKNWENMSVGELMETVKERRSELR